VRYTAFIIANYRAIVGPLKIDVSNRSLTPIIGINESGKTTILHAIFAFDHFNDQKNENGRHLKDSVNLLQISPPPATVDAIVELDRNELLDAIAEAAKSNTELNENFERLRKKRGLPDVWRLRRNISTLKYTIEHPVLEDSLLHDPVSRALIRQLPYTLFFDDFRDKVQEKIEITSPDDATDWLSIIEQLFKRTDKTLSVFKLPKLEERQRKTVLAKVRRRLNETLTREWQNFRLDERDALDISIDYYSEGIGGASRHFIKLEVVETDVKGDQHFFFISDRSKGFYWFFNFVMKLEFNPKIVADGERTIYLLDEPGSYLHAFAQRKLCAKLKQLSSQNRVIYCTHSHYLLDPEVIPISSIAVAEKDGNGNVSLLPILNYRAAGHERRSAMQPVLDALQIKPFALDILGTRTTIITEGIYDYFALEMFRNSRPVAILPSVGADSIKYYISLFIAWQLDFRALWDDDSEGKRRYAEAVELFGEEVSRRNLRTLAAAHGTRRILQDLFHGDDLVMIREELELAQNCSFERTIHALFYSPLRVEVVQRVSTATRLAFSSLYESLSLAREPV
jgi:hypothetical protein